MSRSCRSARRRLAALSLASALVASGLVSLGASPAASTALAAKPRPKPTPVHEHHDVGTMVDPYASGRRGFDGARLTTRVARTVSVAPGEGPDFEVPFRCGEQWVGSTRSSHSPSKWSIDFNRSGDTGRPVVASAPGIVYRVARASGYGNYVIIDHGAGYSTLYAHLQATNVSVGQVLDQGGVLGYVGSSGRVTGPHLHFEQRLNGNYFAPYFHRTRFAYDRMIASLNCGDTPVVGDWDGDGIDDVGVFRRAPGMATTHQRTAAGTRTVRFGYAGHTPFTGDWDGNGIDQIGTRATRSTYFQLVGEDGKRSFANMGGSAKDTPLAGTWVAGDKSGIGLYDHTAHRFTLRLPDLSTQVISFGADGTQPVVGDWDGDGAAEVGTFNVRTAQWLMRRADGTIKKLTYGRAGDIAVTGDWNGDGVTDLGTWRPANARFGQRTVTEPNTTRARSAFTAVFFGARRG